MITSHKNTNAEFLIIALTVLTLIGFFPTYLIKFPVFDNVTNVQHFHGAMMILWFSLLVAQPFLIRYKKFAIHRALGKVSYVIAPLVVYSIFLASQHEYYRDITFLSEEKSLAGLAIDMTSLTAFSVCYILAILNRKNTLLHMRYMVGTALIIMGPGIMRIIIVYAIFGNLDFPTAVLYTYLISLTFGLGLITYDLMKNKPYKPYLVTVSLMTVIYLTYVNRVSDWWLAIAGAIARVF